MMINDKDLLLTESFTFSLQASPKFWYVFGSWRTQASRHKDKRRKRKPQTGLVTLLEKCSKETDISFFWGNIQQ